MSRKPKSKPQPPKNTTPPKPKEVLADVVSLRQSKMLLITILILVAFAFSPGLKNQFTNWDDNRYVVENPVIKKLNAENLHRIFVGDHKFHMGNYHPFTLISLALDYQVAQLNPMVYILHNLVLHLFNTGLVYLLVWLLVKNRTVGLLTMAMFGIATLHVESVTWISERKDVLYTFYFLASAIAYIYYVEKQKTGFYVLAFLFFAISLLAKGQAVSLAVTLVIIDFVLKRKIRSIKILLEKVPFFVLALIMGIVAIQAQSAGEAIQEIGHYNFIDRIFIAAYGFTLYVVKLIVPFGLSAIYPYPDIINKTIPGYFAAFLIPTALVLWLLFVAFKKKQYTLAFAVAFYIINIALLLQLIPVGSAIMADRYSYIPSIGVYLAIAWGVVWCHQNKPAFFKPALALLAVMFVFQAGATYKRAQVWFDPLTLWLDTTQKSPKAVVAWNNLGSTKDKMGQKEEAIRAFSKAIAYKPDYTHAFYNRGTSFKDLNNLEEALADFNFAIKLDPNFAEAYHNRGIVYDTQGQIQKAIEDFNKALELTPTDEKILVNRGVAYGKSGKFDLALQDFDQAIALQPNNPTAYSNRGLAYDFLKKYDLAIQQYTKAIELDPKFETAYNNRALVKRKINDYKGAVEDFSRYITLNPNAANAYYYRGLDLIQLGNKQQGCTDLQQALKMGVSNAQQALNQYCN